MMQMVNEKGERMIESGEFKIYIGGAVPSERSVHLGAAEFLEGDFSVR